jgi:hypothetical protein
VTPGDIARRRAELEDEYRQLQGRLTAINMRIEDVEARMAALNREEREAPVGRKHQWRRNVGAHFDPSDD